MKKVLTISALGCLATIGALFATFTIDPTNVSEEILAEDVDIDLDKHIFSEFKLLSTDEAITFNASGDKKLPINVRFNRPNFKYDLKSIYDQYGHDVGSNLDLECLSYSNEQLDRYVDYRAGQTKVREEEPRGYAFRYRYEQKFLDRCKQTLPKYFTIDDLNYYAIYKTSFKGGVSSSNLANDKISGLGVHYRGNAQPDPKNPIYNDLAWEKTPEDVKEDLLDDDQQIRTDSFIIKPDLDVDGLPLTSGYIIFNGAQFTTNLFEGQFKCTQAQLKQLEDYIQNGTVGDEPVKYFRNRIKVFEYNPPHSYTLDKKDATKGELFHLNGDTTDELTPNERYKFSFTVDANVAKSFKENNARIDSFALHANPQSESDTGIIPLISNNQPEGETYTPEELLGLKITKTDNNGEHDASSYFSYDNDPESATYGSIISNIPAESSNSSHFDSFLLYEGDVFSVEFNFRKSFAGFVGEKVPWVSANLKIDGLLSDITDYQLEFDTTSPEEFRRYVYDNEDRGSIIIASGEQCTVSVPIDNLEYSFDRMTAVVNESGAPIDPSLLFNYTDNISFVDDSGITIGDALIKDIDYYINDFGSIAFYNMDYIIKSKGIQVGDLLRIKITNSSSDELRFTRINAMARKNNKQIFVGDFDEDTLTYDYAKGEELTVPFKDTLSFYYEYNSADASGLDLSFFYLLDEEDKPMHYYQGEVSVKVLSRTDQQEYYLNRGLEYTYGSDQTQIYLTPGLLSKLKNHDYIVFEYNNSSETDVTIHGARLGYSEKIVNFNTYVPGTSTEKGGPNGTAKADVAETEAVIGKSYEFTVNMIQDTKFVTALKDIHDNYQLGDDMTFTSDFTVQFLNDGQPIEINASTTKFVVLGKSLPDQEGYVHLVDTSGCFRYDADSKCYRVGDLFKTTFFGFDFRGIDKVCVRLSFEGEEGTGPTFDQAIIKIASTDR